MNWIAIINKFYINLISFFSFKNRYKHLVFHNNIIKTTQFFFLLCCSTCVTIISCFFFAFVFFLAHSLSLSSHSFNLQFFFFISSNQKKKFNSIKTLFVTFLLFQSVVNVCVCNFRFTL